MLYVDQAACLAKSAKTDTTGWLSFWFLASKLRTFSSMRSMRSVNSPSWASRAFRRSLKASCFSCLALSYLLGGIGIDGRRPALACGWVVN